MNENTTKKTPETCDLFDKMLNAYAGVYEAKDNAAAWNKEASTRMKNVNTLIRAQQSIDPEAPDRETFVKALKERFESMIEEERGKLDEETDPDISEETPSGSYDDVNPEDTNA